MEALDPSSADPLPPASGLSAPPPVPISSSSSRPPVKDATSTIPSTYYAAAPSTAYQPRSGIVPPIDDPVTSITTAAAVPLPKEKETSSPTKEASTPNKWPSLRSTTNTTTRMLPPITNAALAKPLVPLSERRSHQRKPTPRTLKDSDSDHQGSPRWDITPDGGSAGREGRQFTVANVGNNGRIYLR